MTTSKQDLEMLNQLDDNRTKRTHFIGNGYLYAATLRQRDRHTIMRALSSTIAYTYNELAQYEEKMARHIWRMDIKQKNLAEATDPEVIQSYKESITNHQKIIWEIDQKIKRLQDALENYFTTLSLRRQSTHVLKRAEVTEADPV